MLATAIGFMLVCIQNKLNTHFQDAKEEPLFAQAAAIAPANKKQKTNQTNQGEIICEICQYL